MNLPFLKCCSVSKNQGNTEIRIKSSCFEHPIIINLNSDDEKIKYIEEMLKKILTEKEFQGFENIDNV